MDEENGRDNGFRDGEHEDDNWFEELENARAGEKEKEKKLEEMERLYYMVRARLNRELGEQKGADAAAMITMTMDALGQIHETTKTVVLDALTGRDDKEKDQPEAEEEAGTETTPAHRMKLKSELRELKLADAVMAADYEKELGQKEYLAVECAEGLNATGESLRNRLAAEQKKGKPDAELVSIYQQLLDAGGDGAKKKKIFETVKENREEAIKEFFMKPVEDGSMTRLEQMSIRGERERKIQKTLNMKIPVTLEYLIEREREAERALSAGAKKPVAERSRAAEREKSASAAVMSKSTAAPELSMTRTLRKKSQD